jgi:hypothetical protein
VTETKSYALASALRRARGPVVWIGLTYLLGVVAGTVMVHSGDAFALRYRDDLVGTALTTDQAAIALAHGLPLRAALVDFAGNLGLGAVPSTIMGLAVVLPFPLAAYRGWVGGIVSVDSRHESRLRPPHERAYYIGVLVLQLVPYSLAGGAGVRLGLAFLFPAGRYRYPSAERWLGLPAEGVRDVLWVYGVVVPLFLVASLVEFLAR